MQIETETSILSDISDLEESSNDDSTPYQNQNDSKTINDQNCTDDEFDLLINQRNMKKNQDEQAKLNTNANKMMQHIQNQSHSGVDAGELDEDDDLDDDDSNDHQNDDIDQYLENEQMILMGNKKTSRNENPLIPYNNQMIEITNLKLEGDVPPAQKIDPQSMKSSGLMQTICTKTEIKYDPNSYKAIQTAERARSFYGPRGHYSKMPLKMETQTGEIIFLPFRTTRIERNNNNGDWKQIRLVKRKADINERVKRRFKVEKKSKIEAIKELIQKGELPPDSLSRFHRVQFIKNESSDSKSERNSKALKQPNSGSDDQDIIRKRAPPCFWTASEDKLFVDLVKKHGKQWRIIAGIIGQKNENQCRVHGLHLYNKLKQYNYDNELYQIFKNPTSMGAKQQSQVTGRRKKVLENKQNKKKSSSESTEQISDTGSEDLETTHKIQNQGKKQEINCKATYSKQPVNPNRLQLRTRLLTNKNDKQNVKTQNARKRDTKIDSKNSQKEQQNPFLSKSEVEMKGIKKKSNGGGKSLILSSSKTLKIQNHRVIKHQRSQNNKSGQKFSPGTSTTGKSSIMISEGSSFSTNKNPLGERKTKTEQLKEQLKNNIQLRYQLKTASSSLTDTPIKCKSMSKINNNKMDIGLVKQIQKLQVDEEEIEQSSVQTQ